MTDTKGNPSRVVTASQPLAHRLSRVSLDSLIAVYYPDPKELGAFQSVSASETSADYNHLLNHNHHMTVTVEAYYRDSVNVKVLRSSRSATHYCREILLTLQKTKRVVQYGIVRLNLATISEAPRTEILEEKKPLGRVLIEHQVLREIELFDLVRVSCGSALAKLFSIAEGTTTFGRTAMIYCNNEPAIELLEIVTPIDSI